MSDCKPEVRPIGVFVGDSEFSAEAVDVIAVSQSALAIFFFAADPRIQTIVDEMTGTTWQPFDVPERTKAGMALWIGSVVNALANDVRAACLDRVESIFAQSREMRIEEETR